MLNAKLPFPHAFPFSSSSSSRLMPPPVFRTLCVPILVCRHPLVHCRLQNSLPSLLFLLPMLCPNFIPSTHGLLSICRPSPSFEFLRRSAGHPVSYPPTTPIRIPLIYLRMTQFHGFHLFFSSSSSACCCSTSPSTEIRHHHPLGAHIFSFSPTSLPAPNPTTLHLVISGGILNSKSSNNNVPKETHAFLLCPMRCNSRTPWASSYTKSTFSSTERSAFSFFLSASAQHCPRHTDRLHA